MPDDLDALKEIVEKHEGMYKSAETYITVLDGYIVSFFAILSPREHSPETEKLVELNSIEIIREHWKIEEVFDKKRSKGITLEKFAPFVWTELTNENIRMNSGSLTEFNEHKYLFYMAYSSEDGKRSELDWDGVRREVRDGYGVGSLLELFEKVTNLPKDFLQNIVPELSRAPGFYIATPIYVKMRRCGIVNRNRLKAVVESIGISDDVIIWLNPKIPGKKAEKLRISKEGKPIMLEGVKNTGELYEISFNIPENCKELDISLKDESIGRYREIFPCSLRTDFRKKLDSFESRYPKRKLILNILAIWVEHNPALIFLSLGLLLLMFLVISLVKGGIGPTYASIIQTFVVLLNAGLVYILVLNYRRDKKEREKELAVEAVKHLENMKSMLEEVHSAVLIDGVDEGVYRIMNFESIEPDLNFVEFFRSEAGEVLLDFRRVPPRLYEYSTDLSRSTKSKTLDRVNSVIETIDNSISRIMRDYHLHSDRDEVAIRY